MSVGDLTAVNLRALERQYAAPRSPARRALRLCRRAGDAELASLLRNHRQRAVLDEGEVRDRDAVDELLELCSYVELGALIGFCPARLTPDFRDTYLPVLEQDAVARYHERHYPLLLPRLLRLRLQGEARQFPGAGRSDLLKLFVSFLDVNRALADEGVETFQWFLDDGEWDGQGLSDLLEVLADPEQLQHSLSRRKGRTRLDLGVQGFRDFFVFCADLDALLARCSAAGHPLVASAFWHFHAYWFHQARRKVREALKGALLRMKPWMPPGARQVPLGPVVERLLDEERARPLVEWAGSRAG